MEKEELDMAEESADNGSAAPEDNWWILPPQKYRTFLSLLVTGGSTLANAE